MTRIRIIDCTYFIFELSLSLYLAWKIYQTSYLFITAFVALLGIAIAIYCTKKHFPAWLIIIIGFLGYLLGGLVANSSKLFTGYISSTIKQLFLSPIFSWKQLATLDLPVGSFGTVLAPYFIVLYLSALLSALTYFQRPQKVHLLSVCSFIITAFGVVFGAKTHSPDILILGVQIQRLQDIMLGILQLLVTILWLNLRSKGSNIQITSKVISSTNSVKHLLSTIWNFASLVVIIAISITASVHLAPTLAGNTFLNLRANPVVITPPNTSPLDYYRSFFKPEAMQHADTSSNPLTLNTPLLQVSGDIPDDQYIHFAILPNYDGVAWSASSPLHTPEDEFHQLVYKMSPEKATSKVHITNLGFNSSWLPTVQNTVSIEFQDNNNDLESKTFINRTTNSLILSNAGVVNGKIEGDMSQYHLPVGTSYDLLCAHMQIPPDNTAPVNSKPHFASPERTPNLMQWLNKMNSVVPGNTVADVKKLSDELAYYSYLSRSLDDPRKSAETARSTKTERISKTWLPSPDYQFAASTSGSSYARVDEMFENLLKYNPECKRTDTTSACGVLVGDEQQFASAIALLSDAKGFDTRMVVGAKVPESGEVRGEDVRAWVEIRADSTDNWTPVHFNIREDNKIPVVAPQSVPNAYNTDTHRIDSVNTSVPEQKPQSGTSETVANTSISVSHAWIFMLLKSAFWWLFLLLLFVTPFATILIAKKARKLMRSRIADVEVRITSQWMELVDFRTDCGELQPALADTRKDYALKTGNENILQLAHLADRAVYAEFAPNSAFYSQFDVILQGVITSSRAKMKPLQKAKMMLSIRSLINKPTRRKYEG
ncbi:MAG: hypothetical protein LBI63_02530 [Candidatus Ancillula sp.]|jgi:hypothetical protein|nr:hypothetical protein [Candidatus Ancillula sp.]